jgi:hypothetical protein
MRPAYALGLDLVMVVLFAAIGRADHEHGLAPLGVLGTAAPFLAAAVVGWGLAYLVSAVRSHDPRRAHTFRPTRPFPDGVIIWIATVGVGMTARGLLTTSGAPPPSFVIVATVFLGLFLLGWRGILVYSQRRAAQAGADS